MLGGLSTGLFDSLHSVFGFGDLWRHSYGGGAWRMAHDMAQDEHSR